MNRPSFWIMCGVLLAAAPPVSAQSAGHEPAVFELPPNARAAGMGHAFQLGTPSSDVVFYNPALVGRATGFLFGFQRYEETSGSLSLSTATTFMGGP